MSKKNEVSRRTLWSIILLSFSGELAWAVENQYFNVFIYQELAPEPLFVSLMVGITAAVSTFTTILMGTLSDVKGKRKPFLLVGYIFWTITTAIFPLAGYLRPVWLGVTIAILFDSIMSFFGATANDAALNAYVTDVTTLENRGKVGSVKEIMFLLGVLVVYGAGGPLIELFDIYIFFYIVAIIVGIIGIPGALLTPEPDLSPSNLSYWESIKTTYTKEALFKNKNFFKILVSTGLWGIAFNVFFPYVLIYLDTDLNIDIGLASILIFIALLVSIILAFPVGKLVDKIGRKQVALLAVLIESVALFLFALSGKNVLFLAITSIFWVFAMLSYNIASRTWLKDLYPEEKRGQFHGFYLFFNVFLGMTIGPFIGGVVARAFGSDYVNEYGVPGYTPSMWVFIFAAILMLLALIPLISAKESKER
ncbi:MAG: MFS transporter [Candidatus Lokiarchaeota archaeon]|nr:MFS transporter [Candidatus Lokiarchaeota archaeon]